MNLQKRRLTVTVAVVAACLLLIVTCFWQVMFVCGVFVCGLLLGRSICSADYLLPNVLLSHIRRRNIRRQTDDLKLLKKICPVCGNAECKRHRELNVLALKPWIDLELPESVDTALTDFLNQVLKEFVYNWYSDLSQDEAFVDEIRSGLRFIASVLLRRLQKVDIPTFVTDKVLNTAMRHLHTCLLATRDATSQHSPLKMPSGQNVEQRVLNYYGSSLHCALHSRRSELNYMRKLTELVFPFVLPSRSLRCRSLCSLLRELLAGSVLLRAMDVLADPDKLNVLLLLFFDKATLDYSHAPVSPFVPMLEAFCQPRRKSPATACTKLQLQDILDDQDVLFSFMKFMKAEASVNVLQFYLSIEEFNKRLLTPELSESQLVELHKQLTDICRMYVDAASADCVKLDDDIITQFNIIRDGSPEDVVKLQNTRPLFQAHEHVCALLEHTFIPLYLQSDIYYTMVCGERLPTKPQPSSARSSGKRTGEMLTLSRIGSKIKGVFRGGTVEGQFICSDMDYEAIDSDLTLDKAEALPITGGTERSLDGLQRVPSVVMSPEKPCDLSAWRVTIPKIRRKPEPDNPRKDVLVFCIQVHRVDITEGELESSNWMLERRYHEFYVLDQKLQEFHGELEDAQLPSKKTFLPKTIDFFDTQRDIFENYLQKLLSKPVLRGSELLRRFLTSEDEFMTSFLDVNLGKMMKSGAMRLVKERGQNLDPFLKSFLISTESSKPKPGRTVAETDADCISTSTEKLMETIYDNNADRQLGDAPPLKPSSTPASSLPDGAVDNLTSIYDSIVYIALHIFDAPQWCMQALLVARLLVRNTVDSYLDWYIGKKLELLMNEHQLERIIHLLHDALFLNQDPPRTDDDKQRRREQTLLELQDFIPKLFVHVIGPQKHHAGTELLFDFLQQPRLNKQLSYMLLDQVIMEVFPELSADDTDDCDSADD